MDTHQAKLPPWPTTHGPSGQLQPFQPDDVLVRHPEWKCQTSSHRRKRCPWLKSNVARNAERVNWNLQCKFFEKFCEERTSETPMRPTPPGAPWKMSGHYN